MTEPTNKIALITGAGGGFGRHMVRQFRGAGARLLLTDLADEALSAARDDAGDDLIAAFAADLSTDDGCAAVAAHCAEHGVLPDILINNAGIAFAGRADHVPRDQWEKLLQLNLLGPMRLCDLLLPATIC